MQWSDNWRDRFYDVDVDTILALDASAQRFTVKKSKITQPDAELDLFASRKAEKARRLGPAMAPLHLELANERKTTKKHGKGMMPMTAVTFQKRGD